MNAIRRVVLVVWWLDRFGGMERHVTELACALRRAGVEVLLLSEMPLRRTNPYVRQLRREGVALISAPRAVWVANGLRHALQNIARDHPAGAADLRRLTASSWLDRWLVRELDRECRTVRPDVVHVHGCRLDQAWLLRWAQARQVPSVYTEHVAIRQFGGPLESSGPELALAASALTCVSGHARRDLLSVLPAHCEVAVSAHIVKPEEHALPGKRENRFDLLCPARLESHKGIDVLLRAFALIAPRHPNARLVLAGGGRMRYSLRSLASDLGIQNRVVFCGVLTSDAMSRAFRQAGAVVLASRTEGMPMSIVEALAHGAPIVATSVGGIPEIIRNGENGLLVEPGNAGELAGALDLLLSDEALRMRLGTAARQSFLEGPYREERAVAETLRLYHRAACLQKERVP